MGTWTWAPGIFPRLLPLDQDYILGLRCLKEGKVFGVVFMLSVWENRCLSCLWCVWIYFWCFLKWCQSRLLWCSDARPVSFSDTFRTSLFIVKGVVNFSEGLKVKVIVSDFNFRNIYLGICLSTFAKSNSSKLPSFKSSSDCFQIIRSSSEGVFLPLVLTVRVCGSSSTDKRPCQISFHLLNKNV